MKHHKKFESESNREKIRNSIPEAPNKIRSGDLLNKLMQQKISNATIVKHLKQLVEEGYIKRIEKSHKEVYYQKGKLSKIDELVLLAEKITPEAIRQAYNRLDKNSRETFLNSLWEIVTVHDKLMQEQKESEENQSKA